MRFTIRDDDKDDNEEEGEEDEAEEEDEEEDDEEEDDEEEVEDEEGEDEVEDEERCVTYTLQEQSQTFSTADKTHPNSPQHPPHLPPSPSTNKPSINHSSSTSSNHKKRIVFLQDTHL